jgi:two-component system, OmpR family, KDP operon response regulator KdpE
MSNKGALALVVEDEAPLRSFLRTALTAHGYRVIEAATLGEALIAATTANPEVVLLDLGLPDGSGLELVRRVREWGRLPIVVISARGREQDKIEALDAGADDYLTKPFGTGELLARLRAALRHAAPAAPAEPVVEVGPLRIDLGRRQVFRDGVEVHLTATEYRLLALLARNAGRVLTHAQVLREVWGPNQAEHTHYVRVYMAELRRKLEDDPTRPRWLLTEVGVGYRLRDDR